MFFFNIQDQKRLWKFLYVIFWDEMQLIDNINKKLKYDLRKWYTDSLLLLLLQHESFSTCKTKTSTDNYDIFYSVNQFIYFYLSF